MTTDSRFVEDGGSKLRNSPEFQTRLRELRESIRARYEVQFGKAGFFRRYILRWKIEAEYRRERRKLMPSWQSLYVNHR